MNHLITLVNDLAYMQGMAITFFIGFGVMFCLVCIAHTQNRAVHDRGSVEKRRREYWQNKHTEDAHDHLAEVEELELLLDTSNEHSEMQAQHIAKLESELSLYREFTTCVRDAATPTPSKD